MWSTSGRLTRDGREATAILPLVKIPAHLHVTDEQFVQLVKANPDLRMEHTAEGELLVMPLTGS